MNRLFILLVLSIILIGCFKSSKQDNTNQKPVNIFFPEKTQWVKEVLDSLGELNEYKRDRFILYCKNDSYSDKNKEFLFTQIDEAVLRIKEVLKIDTIPQGFYLIMLDSREEMGKIFGHNYKGLSIRNDNLALFVYNKKIRPYFKHELFHLIAFQEWGNSKTRLLNEGGAMYTDNECLYYKNPITVLNKYLYEKNKWFDIEDLINNFSEKSAENDMIAYLESAYIFRHLYENYGKEKMIKLWLNGFSEIKKIYGFDVQQLKKDMNKEMKNIEYKEINWNELMEKGCG